MVTDRSSFLENQVEQFKEGDHYRSFGNEDELDAVIEQLLGDEPLRTQISENGHQWAMKHHTAEARVRQMLEKIRGQG